MHGRLSVDSANVVVIDTNCTAITYCDSNNAYYTPHRVDSLITAGVGPGNVYWDSTGTNSTGVYLADTTWGLQVGSTQYTGAKFVAIDPNALFYVGNFTNGAYTYPIAEISGNYTGSTIASMGYEDYSGLGGNRYLFMSWTDAASGFGLSTITLQPHHYTIATYDSTNAYETGLTAYSLGSPTLGSFPTHTDQYVYSPTLDWDISSHSAGLDAAFMQYMYDTIGLSNYSIRLGQKIRIGKGFKAFGP